VLWVWLFVMGGVGAVTRVGVAFLVPGRFWPWGTFIVNLVGCLLIGLLFHVFQKRQVDPMLELAVISGLLGGLTTFSAFGLETWRMAGEGRLLAAALYAMASVVLGIAAVGLGLQLGRLATP